MIELLAVIGSAVVFIVFFLLGRLAAPHFLDERERKRAQEKRDRQFDKHKDTDHWPDGMA